MLAFHMRLAVWVNVYVEGHRVAADRAVFDVVLVRAPGDIHWHDDLFAAGVADKGSFEMNGWLSAAAFWAFLGHVTQKCSPSPCACWPKARCQCWALRLGLGRWWHSTRDEAAGGGTVIEADSQTTQRPLHQPSLCHNGCQDCRGWRVDKFDAYHRGKRIRTGYSADYSGRYFANQIAGVFV